MHGVTIKIFMNFVHRLSRNDGNELPLLVAYQPRRTQF